MRSDFFVDFVMQMYHFLEHICSEKKKALFSWPQTSCRTTFVSTKTGQELGAQDTVRGKSVLMHNTADGDAIQIHIKKTRTIPLSFRVKPPCD